ncbi:MAG: hypothetical protein V2I39_01445 [Erythrobacter sp.]|jgi:hypothetical protein|nr:hypothetical protein [Erythrobacter sp.]
MSRAIALTRATLAYDHESILRTVVVTATALALILAGAPFSG